MRVFLAYCAYTVWLGECIPGTGTYANAYANQLKDRWVSLFVRRRLWPSKPPLNCAGWRHRRMRENVCGSHFHSWGHVVAGSNPVSPTIERSSDLYRSEVTAPDRPEIAFTYVTDGGLTSPLGLKRYRLFHARLGSISASRLHGKQK